MHRTITLLVPTAATDAVVARLAGRDAVIGLTVDRGGAMKPPGDVVTVYVLNHGADDVMRAAADAGPVVAVSAEVASLSSTERQDVIVKDVDVAIWEEMEAGLRHQGMVTPNFLALMATGGALAMLGYTGDPVVQALSFASASIIAPGFEPLAKIPLGAVLRRWDLMLRGLVSTLVGYATLILAAGLTFKLLEATGHASVEAFVGNREVEHLRHERFPSLLASIVGSVAGAVMIVAYRRSVIAGPLIILAAISAAAMAGGAVAVGRWDLAGEAMARLAEDAAIIVAASGAVFGVKLMAGARRKPLS